MKIIFFGDSITDAGRNRENDNCAGGMGYGYVRTVAGELLTSEPSKYQILNRGISGDRVVDIYARIKKDVWNEKPDLVSILIGANDVWHEIQKQNGVDIERYEKIFKMLIEDTKKVLPNVKFIILEPFVVEGYSTEEEYAKFLEIKNYAKIAKKIAKEYNIPFVETQKDISDGEKLYGKGQCITDGVHPNVIGATILAKNWLKIFKENF